MFKGHEFSVERIESGFASSLSWISLDDCRFSKVCDFVDSLYCWIFLIKGS